MEEFKVTGGKLMEKLKALIKEGNVRRVMLRNPQGRVLMDLPLNAGIAGAAPPVLGGRGVGRGAGHRLHDPGRTRPRSERHEAVRVG